MVRTERKGMAVTKDYQTAKAWGTDPVYRPYFVEYVRDETGEIVDHNYRYLGHFQTEVEAVGAIRQNQNGEYGYVERYRWDFHAFDDDKYGHVQDAVLEQDERYEQLEVEPV